MTSRADMRHDLHEFLPDMSVWDKMTTWAKYYWWPTRRWLPKVERWWYYSVRRWPKPPPLTKDRIAHHHGFVEGIPACTDGPVCAEHGWELSPLVTKNPGSREPGAEGERGQG